jgi:SAM-dependent methyltransferase
MKLNIGSRDRPMPGFTSVDIRPVGRNVKRGHAGDLGFAPDGSVELLFCNAVFEHLFPAHQLRVLREWRRVLKPNGDVVILAIPDFETIASLYLEAAPGIFNPRFDLYEVYRYTHGDPEAKSIPLWERWNPARRPNSAPSGYLPQLHKSLFDATYLTLLFEKAEMPARIFRYVYPGETPSVQLGVVAGGGAVDAGLALIPGIETYVDMVSVTEVGPRWGADAQMREVEKLDTSPAPPVWHVTASWAKRRLRSI